jgi:hypothetical protein
MRVNRVPVLETGQDEVYFLLMVSVLQPFKIEVGVLPPAVGVVSIILIAVRTCVALVTVVSAARTHRFWRERCGDGVQRSALQCHRD